LTQTATTTCAATTRSGVGCQNAPLPGDRWCHGHSPDRAQDRVRIASQGGRARSRPDTENVFSVGAEEQAARDQAVAQANFAARGLDTVISTRARHLKDDKPPPDRLVARDATRRAQTRLAWSRWHREQAQRHRRALTDLIVHHEGEARRLGGGPM